MNPLTKEQLEINKAYSAPDYGNTNTPYDTGAIQVSKIHGGTTGQTSAYKVAPLKYTQMPPSQVFNYNKSK